MAVKYSLLIYLLALPVFADEAPKLGVATNFGQNWSDAPFEASQRLPAMDFRDAIRWRYAEKADGTIIFDESETIYPDRLAELGATMSLTVNDPHPLYDGGNTPTSAEGQAAFGNFAAVAVQRFANIHSVEVGNEMNSATFASGPGWDGDLKERARSYASLLKATAEAVRAVRPDVRVLGGATHSIPLPWFEEIFAAGGAEYMDAIVLHPYGTPPEQLRRQITLLRAFAEAADMPIEITEWGSANPDEAPDHLIKGYCQFALAGVTRFIWYPLNERGDRLIPLVDRDGLTPAGRAYKLAYDEFEGEEATDLGIYPFTYGCAFGENAMVLWGAPRDVVLADGIQAYASDSTRLATDDLRLDRERAVVLLSDSPMQLGMEVQLGPHGVIADSFDQFAYPGSTDGPFTLLAEHEGEQLHYATRPGQERGGVPWSPYLGNDLTWRLIADAETVLPRYTMGAQGWSPVAVVQRYRADRDGSARMEIEIAPAARSVDGVILKVRQNGKNLFEKAITGPEVVRLDLTLTKGLETDVIVGPGHTEDGDITSLRTRYLEAE